MFLFLARLAAVCTHCATSDLSPVEPQAVTILYRKRTMCVKLSNRIQNAVKVGLSPKSFLLQNYEFMYFHQSIHLNGFMVY